MTADEGTLGRGLRVISGPVLIALPVSTVGSFREFAQAEGLRQWTVNEQRWLPLFEVAITQAWAAASLHEPAVVPAHPATGRPSRATGGDARARGNGTYTEASGQGAPLDAPAGTRKGLGILRHETGADGKQTLEVCGILRCK